MRGSLAAINPLRQDRIRLEDSAVEAEWVKARVYSMSYRLVKQLKAFSPKKTLRGFKQGKHSCVILKVYSG